MNKYSERLEQLRNTLGLKKIEFSNKLGLAQQTYINYSRDRAPSLECLSNTIETFGINCHWLMTGEGEMFPKDKQSEINSDQFESEIEELKGENTELKQAIDNLKAKTIPPDAELLENLQKVTMEVIALSNERRELQEQLANITTNDENPSGETTNKNDSELGIQLAGLMKEHKELQKEYSITRTELADKNIQLLEIAAKMAKNKTDKQKEERENKLFKQNVSILDPKRRPKK